MGSFKRLQHIQKIVANSNYDLSILKSSTLVMNCMEVSNLRNLEFPNMNFESKFKHQISIARQMGLLTPLEINKSYDIVIVSVSKSKEESLAQIAIGYDRTKHGGILIVEGSKTNGIDAIVQRLSKLHILEHLVAKSHGKIAVLKVLSKKITPFHEWLDFAIPCKNEDGFYSMPGLFSHKRIDPASKFLSTLFDNKLKGDIIDLGAGWGFLSSKLLSESLNLKSITLVDHDQKAIDCAQKNIKSAKAVFKWMDIQEITQLGSKFDSVICNPPFHSAEGRNVDLGKNFIKAAHSVLNSTGSLLLVSNIQLPYENLINTLFKNSFIVAKNKYFKIILAKRPKKYYGMLPKKVLIK